MYVYMYVCIYIHRHICKGVSITTAISCGGAEHHPELAPGEFGQQWCPQNSRERPCTNNNADKN